MKDNTSTIGAPKYAPLFEHMRPARPAGLSTEAQPAAARTLSEEIRERYREIVEADGKAWSPDRQTLEAIDTAARWLEDPAAPWCLILSGTPGNGKTTLLQALRAALRVRRARSVPNYYTALEVADYAENDRILFNSICKDFSFVALDDIGTEPPRIFLFGTERTPVKTALEERYSSRLRTILVTNLGPREIRDRYGDRVADRIRDAAIVPFAGASYRGRTINPAAV